MTNIFKKFFYILTITVLGTIFSANAQIKEDIQSEEPAKTKEELLRQLEGEYFEGDANAPVTIIEYASMSCSHCANFHSNIYTKIKKDYIETGKVKFIFRHFPLNAPALRGAMLVECVDEQRRGRFKDVLFKTQGNWAYKKNFVEVLANISKLGGLSSEDFDSCMKDSVLERKMIQYKKDAVEILEVKSTPTLYVNGVVEKNLFDYDLLAKKIDSYIENEK